MTLDKINLVISTVWREESYLETTLNSLSNEYPFISKQPISLIVGSPVTTHIERYQSSVGIDIIEMGPNTWSWIKNNPVFHRATWNYYRCLTHPVAGTRGTLVVEDDIRFARGWRNRLNTTLAALEDSHGSNFVLALYAGIFSARKARHRNHLFVEYPYEDFFGTQGIYYPEKIRRGFAKHLKVHGVVANETHYDFILRQYLIQSHIPLFATSPCLIQHIGRTSAIKTVWHESSDFVENVMAKPVGEAQETP